MTIKYHNVADRGAGPGIVKRGSIPMKRGIWDLYETTHPFIGLFERCYWIEPAESTGYLSDKERDEALEEIAKFFELNIQDNMIMLECSNMRIMGGVSVNAGTSYLNEKERKRRGLKDRHEDHPSVQGYELRFSQRDAVTFLSLWRGYERPSTEG